MARMGNWRDNKDDEIKLDGIGGVNIMVKADVHRSGLLSQILTYPHYEAFVLTICRHQLPRVRLRKSSRNGRIC
jgi:hypothetical protein